MSPPQLPADAPVLDVAHPLEIGLCPVVGHEARAPCLDSLQGGLRERRDFHVPLIGEVGLEHGPGAIATRHFEAMLFDALEETGRFQLGDDALACLESIQAAEALRDVVVELGPRSEDVDLREAVAQPDVIVVEIMSGGDLDDARTKLRIDIRIGDDGNLAIRQRQAHHRPHPVPIAIVIGVHGDRRIPEEGLRAGRGDHDVTGSVRQRIPEVPQRSVFLLALHFEIGQRGEQHRVPIHQALAAVDQTLGVQAHENLGNRLRQPLIHREPIASPVDRVAQAAHLGRDGAAGLLLPPPDPFDEGIAAQIRPLESLSIELALDDHLCRDARVIRAGLPECAVTAHAVITGQGVHERVLERMAHVKRPRNVRGRNDDAVG